MQFYNAVLLFLLCIYFLAIIKIENFKPLRKQTTKKKKENKYAFEICF